MNKFDLEVNEKDLFGGIDRLLVNFGMLLIAFFPTHLTLLFRPKKIAPLLVNNEPDGRKALLLGPGITLILTVLFLVSVVYIANDVFKIGGAAVDPTEVENKRGGIRDAIVQGNFWRTIILASPVFLIALLIGVIVQVSHVMCRLNVNLTQSVGIGFYILSTSVVFLIAMGITDDLIGGEPSMFLIFGFVVSLFFIVVPWQIFNFSHHVFGNAKGSAAAVAILCAFAFLVCMAFFGFTVWFLESLAAEAAPADLQ